MVLGMYIVYFCSVVLNVTCLLGGSGGGGNKVCRPKSAFKQEVPL